MSDAPYMQPLTLHLIEPRRDPLPEDLLEAAAREAKSKPRKGTDPFIEYGQNDILKKAKRARLALILVGKPHYALHDLASRSDSVTLIEVGPYGLRGWATDQNYGCSPRNALSLIEGWLRPRGASRQPDFIRTPIRQFLAQLDQDILGALKRCRRFEESVYNWISVQPERRGMAVRSYPALVEEMIESPAVAAAITFGGSLEEALADATRLSRAQVRLFAGRPVWMMAKSPLRFDTNLRQQLRETPPHVLPRTLQGWHDFHLLWSMISMLGQRVESDTKRKILADTVKRKGWARELRVLTDHQAPSSAIRSSFDALGDLMHCLLVPAAIATGHANARNCVNALKTRNKTRSGDALIKQIAGDGGLRALLAFSAAWHARVAGRDTAGGASNNTTALYSDNQELQHLTQRPQTFDDGVVATPIRTIGDLRRESAELNHCLARVYQGSLINGSLVAFKLEGPDGLRASCTIRVRDSGKHTADAAHGHNDCTDPRFNAALAALVERVEGEALSGGEETLRIYNMHRGLAGMIEDPSLALENAQAAFPQFAPMLPKRLRAPDAMSLIEGPLFPVARTLCLKAWTKAMIEEQAADANGQYSLAA
ncbi:hypothetical protein CKO28_01480 [Rhodovibrio sodomensis]|uniref:Uncharacterized protein n=1 Tax=Rhodovibrio sodomensis TaxID=1088 RepID=A0ABS1D9R5_9PROT|nr:hypothetical protein [Rhodovibrio sodomensis]MBK1666716.1 hypothetical protein [Rhodovibrio sodomensis]